MAKNPIRVKPVKLKFMQKVHEGKSYQIFSKLEGEEGTEFPYATAKLLVETFPKELTCVPVKYKKGGKDLFASPLWLEAQGITDVDGVEEAKKLAQEKTDLLATKTKALKELKATTAAEKDVDKKAILAKQVDVLVGEVAILTAEIKASK